MRQYIDFRQDLLPPYNSFYDSQLRYDLHPSIYFVFGSNLAGRHGAGAALDAVNDYGAIYGVGEGFAGRSYAIPTKDHRIQTLPLELIERYVRDFVELTRQSNDKRYFVTAIGTGLACYKHEDIAPMFRGAMNCIFPDVWEQYLR